MAVGREIEAAERGLENLFEGLKREQRKEEARLEKWIEEGLQGVMNKRIACLR